MMFFIYSLVYAAFFMVFYPFYSVARRVRRKPPVNIKRRIGLVLPSYFEHDRGRIWIHAVSVGEVNVARPLITRLLKEYPSFQIVLSVTTETGKKAARNLFPDTVKIIEFPLDFKFSVSNYLNLIRPRTVIILETELWPRFIREVSRRGIPLFLINGRISDSAFPNYRRVKPLMKNVLRKFTTIMVQTELYRKRFLSLGSIPDRTWVVSSLKYDFSNFEINERDKLRVKEEIGLNKERLVIGGSTHTGEEDLLVSVFRRLSKKYHDLKLVLVPRRPQRFAEVEQILGKSSIAYQKISSFKSGEEWKILLVDRMGELKTFYSLGSLAFIGGSVYPHGGQNMLEAAAHGVPTLFGPHIGNFHEQADQLLQEGGGFIVLDEHTLYEEMHLLLGDSGKYKTASAAARRVIEKNQGGVGRALEFMRGYLR